MVYCLNTGQYTLESVIAARNQYVQEGDEDEQQESLCNEETANFSQVETDGNGGGDAKDADEETQSQVLTQVTPSRSSGRDRRPSQKVRENNSSLSQPSAQSKKKSKQVVEHAHQNAHFQLLNKIREKYRNEKVLRTDCILSQYSISILCFSPL